MRLALVGLVVLLAFGFMGCLNTRMERKQKRKQKRLNKDIENFKAEFPDASWVDTVYILKNDTLMVEVPRYVFDTTVFTLLDTIVVETERFKTRIEIVKDSVQIPKYFIKTEIKEVQMEVPVVDTITQIRDNLVTNTVYEKYIPYWVWVLVIVCSGLVFWFLIRGNG